MIRLLPRLCAITDRTLAGGLAHELIVRELIAAGASWIQLREKSLPPGQFLAQSRLAMAEARRGDDLPAEGGADSARSDRLCCDRVDRGAELRPRPFIVVNDRADIALAAEADGVHVGQGDLPAELARRLMGERALVGISTHTLEEGLRASALPVDYIAIGPVFATRTKSDSEPVVGLETVRRLAESVSVPVVGIGGIGPANAREVLDAGAHAVAVVSALYGGGRSIGENVQALLGALA